MAYINKFARNCPPKSFMSLLTVQKFKFAGPDPPFDPPKKEEDEAQEEVKTTSKDSKAKKDDAPVEVELTEEEQAELQIFEDFL